MSCPILPCAPLLSLFPLLSAVSICRENNPRYATRGRLVTPLSSLPLAPFSFSIILDSRSVPFLSPLAVTSDLPPLVLVIFLPARRVSSQENHTLVSWFVALRFCTVHHSILPFVSSSLLRSSPLIPAVTFEPTLRTSSACV